ncbi:hypothetical protein K1T71_001144 [Dendrolimus kikuchii]|uniref:Uncharacterized protein n=1 Tax=Dendrolimus kikuchii TaxID=765133 RepID=A0ACC1DGS8_9NEOP|nr:hypothetical protein K1T71_001144 [Dendrolimus kikuchii]
MVMLGTSEQEIDSIINSLKSDSTVGWDSIPTKVLKMAKNILTVPLTHIVNLCIEKGVFPKVFKKSIIHPIFKAGDRNCVGNYRPISVLTSLSKVLEKIVNKRLVTYLEDKHILSNNQFGFRQGKSTEQAVSELVNFVAKHVDNKDKCLGVFLDLAKAFDTVSVPILVNKLEAIGIRGIALKLFKDYLSDRTQKVTIGGYFSKEIPITYGVPQGSVLGPKLFLVYINNLCNLELDKSKIFSYADDTAIIFYAKTWEETKSTAELGLHKISNWPIVNLTCPRYPLRSANEALATDRWRYNHRKKAGL